MVAGVSELIAESTSSDVHQYRCEIEGIPIRIFDLEGANGGVPKQKNFEGGRRAGGFRNLLKKWFGLNDKAKAEEAMNKWQEQRKQAISLFLPSVCYLSCSILLYVDSQPTSNEAWVRNLLSFCQNCSNNTGGPLPVLILIKNRATEFDDPARDHAQLCDIEHTSKEFKRVLKERLEDIGEGNSASFMSQFKEIKYILFPHRNKLREMFLKQRKQLMVFSALVFLPFVN